MQDIASRYAGYWTSDEDEYYAKPKKRRDKWADFEYADVETTTPTYKPYTQSQFGAKTKSSYWSNFGTTFASYEWVFEKKEKRMKLQKSLKELSIERSLPVNFHLGNLNQSIQKSFSANVNLSDATVKTLASSKQKQARLLDAIERLPMKPTLLQKELFEASILGWKEMHFRYSWPVDFDETIKQTRSYFEDWIGSLAEIESRFSENSETKREKARQASAMEEGSECQGNIIDWLRNADPTLWKTLAKKISSKFYFPNIVDREANMRKGKRINRWFLEGNSQKPLIARSVHAPTKKKLMIIIDGSGSMSRYWNGELTMYSNAKLSSAFSYGLMHSGLFNITHTIIHSEYGWANISNRLKKWEVPYFYNNWEGFENIDTTLPSSWAKDADYVLFLTDLCIGEDSQTGMKKFLQSSGKHMILSFESAWQLQWLNVKQVNNFEDMLNGVARLLA